MPLLPPFLFASLLLSGVVGFSADYVEPKRTIANPEINGSSGLAAALFHPGVYYTHNDGNDPRLFAFDDQGRARGTWLLEGLKPHDLEEMASVMAHSDQLLLLADTGDNRQPKRKPADVFHLHLMKAPQPGDPASTATARTVRAADIRTIPFRYEGGPVDCEALAVDLLRGQILLINKVPRNAPASGNLTTNVYSLDLWKSLKGAMEGETEPPGDRPEQTGKDASRQDAPPVLTARRIIAAMPPLPEQITAMDIAPDGSKAVIQTYDDAYEFDFDTDWATTLSQPYSRKIPVNVEPTGHPKNYTFREAICYGRDGKSLYITRELSSWEIENTNHRTPLWRIR